MNNYFIIEEIDLSNNLYLLSDNKDDINNNNNNNNNNNISDCEFLKNDWKEFWNSIPILQFQFIKFINITNCANTHVEANALVTGLVDVLEERVKYCDSLSITIIYHRILIHFPNLQIIMNSLISRLYVHNCKLILI